MSDEPTEPDQDDTSPTFELLRGVDATFVCWSCGDKNWWLLDRAHSPSYFVYQNSSLETYSVACMKCGLVRQHVRVILEGEVKKPAGIADER